MEYLSTGESLQAWIEAGGVVSPHKDAQLDWYTNDADRKYQEILLNASTFRFDGSDLMPGAVGAGTFWEGMVNWVSGDNLQSVLTDIENSWPTE
jgi:alpha-glucoside transport system substrate-binding protein